MTDDIVTRLRGAGCISCYDCTCGKCEVLAEAVDEIKQLREQNEYLKANIEMLAYKAARGD